MSQHRPHSDQGEQQRAGSRPERLGGGLHLPGGGRVPTVQQMGFALGAALAGVNGSPVGAADDAMMRQASGCRRASWCRGHRLPREPAPVPTEEALSRFVGMLTRSLAGSFRRRGHGDVDSIG